VLIIPYYLSHSLISAPGKVLITGGYLVLDPKYRGCVLTTNARFYSSLKEGIDNPSFARFKKEAKGVDEEDPNVGFAFVCSPQFRFEEFYCWKRDESGACIVLHTLNHSIGTNVFVEQAMMSALEALPNIFNPRKVLEKEDGWLPKEFTLLIQADNDFYSQYEELKDRELSVTTQNLKTLARFNVPKKIHKTGLGSSAALVSSVVASILMFCWEAYGKRKSHCSRDTVLNRVHVVAQWAHSNAQGKIGSGFDIASAVFGSQMYRRFQPDDLRETQCTIFSGKLGKEDPTKEQFSFEFAPVRLPKGFILMCGDIGVGSNTPSMVSDVLRWRKNQPSESEHHWNELNMTNELIFDMFCDLSRFSEAEPEGYSICMETCQKHGNTDWEHQSDVPGMKTFTKLAALFRTSRIMMKKMGDLASVPIEPDEQTSLLDACSLVPGVVGVGVPGAGGMDAIFVIAFGQESRNAVEELWVRMSTKDRRISPLLLGEDGEGLRIESLSFPPIGE
jgi:phosphomevalonate kinase